MKIAASAVIAMLVVYAPADAFAQAKAPPPAAKVSRADVEKVVNAIKNDQAKMAQFCALQKLQMQYDDAIQKKDDKKLAELDKSMDVASKALGEDYENVTSGEFDDASAQLFDGLATNCK